MSSLQLPSTQRRKSFQQLGVEAGPDSSSARRRFSNVSDVVTRKFSNTIGWRSSSVPTAEIVAQGKTMCGQYIRCRLKRSGLFSRKCGLQRLRSVASLPGGLVVREVFPELLSLGVELERMHPKLYTGVARQASATPGGGLLGSDKAVSVILMAVARELLRTDMSWSKVVAMYAVAGGLAVDCVRQGHPEFLQSIIESMSEVLEEELAPWIAENGGWTSLLSYCKPPNTELSLVAFMGLASALVASALFFVLLMRWFGRFTFL